MSSKLPSSFDGNESFYEESRPQKIARRLKEEPLIPLGCALTCVALYRASRSIRAGDHNKTNRMFRHRIYAQAFTLLVIFVGGRYYAEDRKKRREIDGVISEKRAAEKRDAWIRELEAREQEENEAREKREKLKAKIMEKEIKSEGVAKMTLELCERRGRISEAVRSLPWR